MIEYAAAGSLNGRSAMKVVRCNKVRPLRAGRHDAGLGLSGDVGPVAVAVGVGGLVGVAGLGVDDRDDAIRCGPRRGLPTSGSVPRLDVLSRHEGEESNGAGLFL